MSSLGRIHPCVVLIIAFVCLFPLHLHGGVGRGQTTAHQQQVSDLLDRLNAIPVEYRADLVFSMMHDAPSLLSRTQQKKLLLSLFEAAPSAHQATPITNASRDNTLGHQESLNVDWLRYDTLDIQARIVALLRPTWPAASWKLLEEMRPDHKRADCSDDVTAELRPYYDVMVGSLNTLASDVTPSGEHKIELVTGQLRSIHDPAELEGLAHAAGSLELAAADERTLLNTFTRTLETVRGSDREISGVYFDRDDLTEDIRSLLAKEKEISQDPTPLLSAYRQFLVQNLHATACSDASSDRHTIAKDFNQLDVDLIGPAPKPIAPLSWNDVAPTGSGDKANSEAIPNSQGIQDQLHRIAMVFAANQRSQLLGSAGEALQPEPADVQAVLNRMKSDVATGEGSSLASYEQTQSTLMLLIEFLPPGPSFDDSVDAELAFLNLNPIENESPLSWLRAFKELVMISRPVTEVERAQLRTEASAGRVLIMAPNGAAGSIRQTMRRYQSDPIISTYVKYEDVVRPTYVSFSESLKRAPL